MHHLTADASISYKKLNPIMDKLVPIGMNRGSMMLNRSYLDHDHIRFLELHDS